MSKRVSGRVKFFNDEKGYGFIVQDAGGKDIFCHKSDFVDGLSTLISDQKVSYVVVESDRKKGDGKKAVQVRVEQ